MRKNARDLVYLNTKRYISLDSLRVFYLAIIIFPSIMVILGIAAINAFGVTWKSLFPIIAVGLWSLLYWAFVLIIQRKKTKKTFELRFLVNGISGLFISSLFWILYTTISLLTNKPCFDFTLSLWILFFYLIFSGIYICIIVVGVHNGIYKEIRKKGNTPLAVALEAFLASIIPIAGVIGMTTSKWLRAHTNDDTQDLVAAISIILMIFIPALAHINFVQYCYCKKYKILCDEYGNTTSPKLEPQIKVRQIKAKKEISEKTDNSDNSLSKKKIPLIIKILIGIVSVPIIFFIIVFIVFIVFFIKVMIEGV